MSKKIILKCSDSVARTFEVEESVAIHSVLLKNLLEVDFCEITLPDYINSEDVCLVIYYCRKRADAKENEEKLKKCDKILADMYKAPNAQKPMSLIKMLKAAEYLDVKSLVDLSCKILADVIRYLPPLQIRKLFKITGDNTPEDEALAQAWKY